MFKRIWQAIVCSDVIKNISTLASGAIFGYAINLIILPIISRVYSRAELGEYDIVISTGTLLFDVFCLGMITAIMLPKENEDASKICNIIKDSLLFFTTTIYAVLLIVYFNYSVKIFETSQNYLVMLSVLYVYVIAYNLQAVFYSYVNRMKKYKVLFWTPLINAGVNAGVSLLLGIAGMGSMGYLLGTTSAYIINIIYMRLYVNPFGNKTDKEIKKLFPILYRYKTFPLLQMPANFIYTISRQMPVQFLGRIFGAANLGGYTMACKILSIPVSLLATPINRVYYRTASEKLRNNEDVGQFAYDIIRTSMRIAIVPILILMLWGESILGFVLGDEWIVAGSFVKILGIFYLVLFCNSCLSGSFAMLDKKIVSMAVACLELVTTVCVFGVVIFFELGVWQAICLYVIIDIFIQVVTIGSIFFLLKFSLHKYCALILKYVMGTYIVFFIINSVINRMIQ